IEPAPTPPTGPAASANLPAGATVIIYGASWCGPCHETMRYLKSKGVPFVEKDIEESQQAQVEMSDKLRKSSKRGGGIPVIDIGGQILVGFSAPAIDAALAAWKR